MWAWVLIWLLIVGFGGAWLFLLAREVFRKGTRLFDELQTASALASDAASVTNTMDRGLR